MTSGATDDDVHILAHELFVLVKRRDYAIWFNTNIIAASNQQSLNGKRYDIGLQNGVRNYVTGGTLHALELTERHPPSSGSSEAQLERKR